MALKTAESNGEAPILVLGMMVQIGNPPILYYIVVVIEVTNKSICQYASSYLFIERRGEAFNKRQDVRSLAKETFGAFSIQSVSGWIGGRRCQG